MTLPAIIPKRRANRRRRALYRAVSQLPVEVRRAMLGALEDEELIVGAYTDRHGRMCPMLAAHRRGARAAVGEFPRAWDQFARARRPRVASGRELDILRAVLQESVIEPSGLERARGGGPTRPAAIEALGA